MHPTALQRPQATVIAGRCAVPLGVTAQQLQCGNLISTGAESSVYQGTYLGQRVAVKRPRIRTAADLDRFRRELCILTSLQHDSIIRVLAAKALPPGAAVINKNWCRLHTGICYTSRTDYSLVLPWYPKVANEQLHEHGWRPSWHAILTIAAQLATAVHHIHDQGVVHRCETHVEPQALLAITHCSLHAGTSRLATFCLLKMNSAACSSTLE